MTHAISTLLLLILLSPVLAAEEVYCADPAPSAISLPPNLVRRIALCANAQKMEIHAHRGAGNRPENTIAAFREAIRQGADALELDLQITKEDPHTKQATIVVTHDVDLRANQCLAPGGARQDPKRKAYVRRMTLAEAQKYDCGSLVPPWAKAVPGEKIPTLSEVLGLLEENKKLRLNIEIKYPDPKFFPPLEEYVGEIIQTIEASKADAKRFFIQSFNSEALAIVKKKRPSWEISPLVGGGEDVERSILEAVRSLNPTILTPHYKMASKPNPELLRNLQKQGIKVIVWTPNTKSEMMPLIESGVDGIITDRVDIFMEIKNELCGQ